MNVNFPPLPRGSIAIRMARLAFSLLVYSSVAASAQSTTHLDFSYADRTALLNAAWSYTATTASGGARDTEQSGTLAVSYDQASHPGTIRIPLGSGEMWQNANNSQNMLVRSLPPDWSSIRLYIAAFNPVTPDQEVGLLAYQDDDNYISVNRIFGGSNGSVAEMFSESSQSTTYPLKIPINNTGNLILRLDRNGDTYTGFYSREGGVSWAQIESLDNALSNPKLAIQVGGNTASTTPSADLGWVEIIAPSSIPSPTVTSVSPSSGSQGQSLTLTVTGSQFQNGATCNFGTGITVNSCVFSSASQIGAAITIASAAVVGSRNVTVINPDGQTATLANGFAVSSAPLSKNHFNFNYPDRASMLSAGWTYTATTASGGARDTEQSGTLAVSYDQASHPGTIRIPLGSGEMWQNANNSQNMLVRSLPPDWSSIRLYIAAFNPVTPDQEVGLLAYQDDDNYISVNRIFGGSNGSVAEMFSESSQSTTYPLKIPINNTGNLILRLDRNGDTYTGFYSREGGVSWAQIESLDNALSNPKLAIQVGGNTASTTPSADLGWVEIIAPSSIPSPTVTSVSPSSGSQGQSLTLTVTGSQFQNGATCNFGTGITVNSCVFSSASQIGAAITIASAAVVGSRNVTVINPDGQTATLANGFAVSSAPLSKNHFNFNYPDRASMLSAGWTYLATTASGGARDTEQSGTLAVSYDQAAHPGTIRIPLGSGEMWQDANNSQNMLVRSLPADWSSLRLYIAAFNPVTPDQEVGLLAYQDDDNYISMNRIFGSSNGSVVEMFSESGQSTTYPLKITISNTGNLILRIDRSSSTYTGFYSTDGGSSWSQIQSLGNALSNPRLAIQVGGNTASNTPSADLGWVEVYLSTGGGKALTSLSVTPVNPTVVVGNSQQFAAAGTFSDGSTQDLTTSVTWSSSNTTVATISNTSGSQGMATASTAGNSTIQATQGSISGSTILNVIAANVTVSPQLASITSSQTQQFQSSAAGVTWLVDNVSGGNSTIGTISASGFYTPPVTSGSHTITATSGSQNGTATVYVQNFRGVFTWHYDNGLTGQNLNEVALTPPNVTPSHFGVIFSDAVDGYVYAQPLYVANVPVPGLGTRNLIFVATEHDSVYAFDADQQGNPVWKVNFIQPASGITTIPSTDTNCTDLVPEIGITGTPVIDAATSTLYVLVRTKENGQYFARLHALDLATGAEKLGGPTIISASVQTNSGGQVSFDAFLNNQRPGLVLNRGNVYLAFASQCDNGPYHGWLLAYDASTLQQTAAFTTTPDGDEGGAWMSGASPSADANGNVFIIAGNGTFDVDAGGRDYGDSFIKLNSTLSVLDFFTPFNQDSLSSLDWDLGSSGAILLPDQAGAHPHLMLGAGKENPARIYVIDRDNLGRFNSGSDSQIVQTITGAFASGLFSTPAYWNGTIYFAANHDVLKSYTVNNGLLSNSPTSQDSVSLAYPGATPVVSANGNSGAIVWTWENDKTGGNAVLRAYNATDVSQMLYSSKTAGAITGAPVKFAVPTIANGKVYIATQKGLVVFGVR